MAPKPKIVIQPFKQNQPMDPEYVERMWTTLRHAIDEIFAHNQSGLSFEELYRNAYNMVLHKHGDKLYAGLTETVRKHLHKMASEVDASNDAEFLEVLNKKWADHKLSMIMTRDILMYMDRTYVSQQKKIPVYELGLNLFRDTVVRAPRIKERMLAQLLDTIERERSGQQILRPLLRMVTSMLVDLGKDVYQRDFERPFLERTAEFYQREAASTIAQSSAIEYLRRADRRLTEEEERVKHYLDSNTEAKLRETAERELIATHMRALAEMERSGVVALFNDDRREDLAVMYSLFKRVTSPTSGLAVIRDILSAHVSEQGRALVNSASSLPEAAAGAAPGAAPGGASAAAGASGAAGPSSAAAGAAAGSSSAAGVAAVAGSSADPSGAAAGSSAAGGAAISHREPVAFVEELVRLKTRYDSMIELSFHGDKLFHNMLNRAFESFINLNGTSPECLSLYVDNLLRREVRGAGEDEVESTLEQVVMLFRYLSEKDVFEKYYKQHLAKRLLSGRAVSEDLERSMITKLKSECGFQFTSKIEGMFTDIKTSADTMTQFRQHLADANAAAGAAEGAGAGADVERVGSVELSVQVLTTGYWPTQPVANCIFPPEVQRCADVFALFYTGKHSGRTLKWSANMGSADLKAVFGGRRHEINVSTYQMCILLLFNQRDTISYAEIACATHILPVELKRALQSLACAKFKLLIKEPRGRDVSETDSFSFNAGFTAKLVRFKVGTVAAVKETEVEKGETRQKVDEDRKPQVEAAIVRIMKSRKVSEHNLLITEVTQQLRTRFLPDPNMIKKRIESLIEREFLERDKVDFRLYKYLA